MYIYIHIHYALAYVYVPDNATVLNFPDFLLCYSRGGTFVSTGQLVRCVRQAGEQ